MQRFLGRVVSSANPKTIKVCVERELRHPKTNKLMSVRKNYLVHDEKEVCVIGDLVAIEQCEKISTRKYFSLLKIIKEARIYKDPTTGETFTAP